MIGWSQVCEQTENLRISRINRKQIHQNYAKRCADMYDTHLHKAKQTLQQVIIEE